MRPHKSHMGAEDIIAQQGQGDGEEPEHEHVQQAPQQPGATRSMTPMRVQMRLIEA